MAPTAPPLQGELVPLELELGDLAVVDAVARRLSAEPRLDALLLGATWTLHPAACTATSLLLLTNGSH